MNEDALERAELAREAVAGLEYEDYHDRIERFRHEIEEEKRDADPYWSEEDEDDE